MLLKKFNFALSVHIKAFEQKQFFNQNKKTKTRCLKLFLFYFILKS